MARTADKDRKRICLDCNRMVHDWDRVGCGYCAQDGHRIDNVNNYSWCKHYSAPEWRRPYIYPDDFEEPPVVVVSEGLRVLRVF